MSAEDRVLVSMAFNRMREYYANLHKFACTRWDTMTTVHVRKGVDVDHHVVYKGSSVDGSIDMLKIYNILELREIMMMLLASAPALFAGREEAGQRSVVLTFTPPYEVLNAVISHLTTKINRLDPSDLEYAVDLLTEVNNLRMKNEALEAQLAAIKGTFDK